MMINAEYPNSNKVILIGWMSNYTYGNELSTKPWRGQMAIPREVSLVFD